MNAWWYYADNDESVGPMSVEEIVNWIRQARNQPHFVWREGMSDWREASTVPELSTALQAAGTARAVNAKVGAETGGTSAARKAPLAQRARKELFGYFWISAYLYVCFGALILYKASILHSEGIEFTPFGLAIVKALILGKFILILEALKIEEGDKSGSIMLVNIIKRSLLFMVLLIVLTIIEEFIVGYFHGRGGREVLSEIAGATLPQAFAVGLLLFLILIPYFAFHEIAASLGKGELSKLLTERRSTGNRKQDTEA